VGPILAALDVVRDEIPSDPESFSARLSTRMSGRFDRRHPIMADSHKTDDNSVRSPVCRKTCDFPGSAVEKRWISDADSSAFCQLSLSKDAILRKGIGIRYAERVPKNV
jgi:hypothetical protein